MTRWLAPVATVAAAALVWTLADTLAAPARGAVVALLVLLPAFTAWQAAALRGFEGEIPRLGAYLSSAVAIWALAALTVWAGLASGMTPRLLGLLWPPGAAPYLAAIGATAAGLGVLAIGRALHIRETPLLERLLPVSRRERVAFVGLSFTAGIGEELAYRAFLVPALIAATGSTTLAVVLSSGAFGMVHGYQAYTGVLRAALLGAALALSFTLTGSVLPAMIAHTALDLIAGLLLRDWLLGRD